MFLSEIIDAKYRRSENDKYSTGYAIERFRACFVCKKRRYLCKGKRAYNTYYKCLDIRCSAYGKMAHSACKRCCAHYENAFADVKLFFGFTTGFTMNLIPKSNVINTEKLPIVVFGTVLAT